MFSEYWNLRFKPFENTPDPDFFYFSPEHEEAYIRFKYAISENKGATLLTGEYGCGKTTLIRLLVGELSPDQFKVAILNNPRGEVKDLLAAILVDLLDEDGVVDKSDSIDVLERKIGAELMKNYENDKITLLVIDEAQLIENTAVLEEIRLLMNFQLNDRFLIHLFFVGQPELRDRMNSLPQLEQRIFCKYHLHTLDRSETSKYINHRLSVAGASRMLFSNDAIDMIFQNSHGIPRKINNICDLSLLLGGYRKVEIITPEIVQSAL